MSYIAAIETAVPDYCHTQEALTAFYQRSTNDETVRRKIRAVAAKSAIETRYSVIPDYSLKAADYTFFAKNDAVEPEPTLTQRMAIFKEQATVLSLKAIRKIKNFEAQKNTITHIIAVTCTGLFAPGLEVEIIRELKLSPAIQRSSINFMGCNAAIIALNSASAICNSTPGAKVLVVCTELCTIHFQKNYTDDYLLSTALFADGSAAVLVTAENPEAPYLQGLKITAFNSLLLNAGYNEMAWQITEKGFIMNLTSYVSGLINGNMKMMLESIALDPATAGYWAIHPGGKKILDDFSDVMALDRDVLKDSYDVLKNYGNMSSATVLFVLKAVLENATAVQKGSTVFAVAFGPGLSVESMQLKYV